MESLGQKSECGAACDDNMYSVQCTVHCTVASVRAARCRASRCWHVTGDVARCSTAACSLQLHTAVFRLGNIEIYQDSFECDTRQCDCDDDRSVGGQKCDVIVINVELVSI